MATPLSNPLSRALQEVRGALGKVALFSFFINLLILTSPIYMMQIYDRVLGSGHVETLVLMTLIAALAVLIMGLLEMVRGRMLGRISRWLDRKLSPGLIEAAMRGTLYGLPATAQPLRDLTQIRSFLSGPGFNAIVDSPWVPVFIAVIWMISPTLGVLGVISALVLFILAFLNEYVSRRILKAAGTATIGVMQKADAVIRNADVFHAMGMLPGFLRSWSHDNRQVLDLQLSAGDRNATIVGISKFFRIFVQILTLGVGAYLVLQRQLSAGAMIAASIIMGRALAPVEQAIAGWRGFVSARDAYERLSRLLQHLPPPPASMPLPAPSGHLSCEGIIYVPRGRETPILNGISFTLRAGEALGVIGPSAAGKSTLCRILVGSWQPTRGHCRLDGADVFQWPAEHLGPYVGYLPQDVELFGGTVKDNIARLIPDADPEQVVAAARTAGVHEMILRLPKGYETEIGEGGNFLSGGQRQRIGLARALFGQPKLIVLDEPNASLDNEGEESLVKALLAAKSWGATVVIVAHLPRILRPVDKVMLLRDGRIELFGPREEVFAKLRRQPIEAEPRPKIVAQPPTGGA
jgi:PrtD family type I secretion system ABC transporter